MTATVAGFSKLGQNWRTKLTYSCCRDFTECELSESRGREGGYSCDCDFSECELSEESARGREGGSSSGCDFSETGHNPIVEESVVYDDKARTNDIPLILQWSNYKKGLYNLNGEELAMYNDEAHKTYDIPLHAKMHEFLDTLYFEG